MEIIGNARNFEKRRRDLMSKNQISAKSRREYEISKAELRRKSKDGICVYDPKDFIVHAGVLIRYEGASVIAHVPHGVIEIADGAFAGYDKLAEVVLPDTVTTIGEKAFFGCASITEISIPAGVTMIKHKAFYGCTSLRKIGFEKSNRSLYIDTAAFQLCTALESLDTKRDVEYIGKLAFSECFSLRRLILRSKAPIFIDDGAFRNCRELARVEIYGVLNGRHPFLENCRTSFYSKLRRAVFNKKSFIKRSVCCGAPLSGLSRRCARCGLKHVKRVV